MCDTFVATSSFTGNRKVIFAKNSDREPNEAQHLIRIPRHKRNSLTTKATYIEVEHVEEINEIIISKPFQMWGAEIGANEHGLAIGNEAVFTKFKFNKNNVGLTGMDMLRLALERCSSAAQARDQIVFYVEKYGQDACGGYEDKNFYYHNSFIITDFNASYLLETAGKFWAWKKIDVFQSISNGLTLTTTYDEIADGAEAYARQNNWIKKNEAFNFKKAFSSLLMPILACGESRQNLSHDASQEHRGNFTFKNAIDVLRSHSPKRPFTPSRGQMDSVCLHASGLRTPSQTTSSMVFELSAESCNIWATGSSAPCLSIFKPFYFKTNTLLPENFKPPTAKLDDSYWWQQELLHRKLLKSYKEYADEFRMERDQLEMQFFIQAQSIGPELNEQESFSNDCLENSKVFMHKWIDLLNPIDKGKWYSLYDQYWNKLNKKVMKSGYKH